MRFGIAIGVALSAPAAWAFSSGPPAQRTGAPVDGGLSCTACHRTFAPANHDPRGSAVIELATYRPGDKVTIRITVQHPDAHRWGFQITARRASDDRLTAGVFTPSSTIRVVCGATATPAPCNGEKEFATHTQGITRLGANGKMIFEVEWTAPGEDVGDVIFYAAGNAADGTGTNANDVIYTTHLLVRNAAGCSVTGAPSVSGLSNAASGQVGLAYNTLFSIYGSAFVATGRTREAKAFDFVDGRYPAQLDCVAVLVDGVKMPLTYVQANQINAQARAGFQNPGKVELLLNPGTAAERRIPAGVYPTTETQPAFFTFNGTSVKARFQDGVIVANPAVVPGARAAKPGEIVQLYLTGLGVTDPVYQEGEVNMGQAPLARDLVVEIGGQRLTAADVLYAGLAGQSISGLYQINIRIPAGLAAGDRPIVARVASGGTTQNGTTIPIAAP